MIKNSINEENMDINRSIVINNIKKTYKWLSYFGFVEKINDDGRPYTLIKFTDNTGGELILWVYLYNDTLDLEFRKSMTAEIDWEKRDIKINDFEAVLEENKYLY